MKNSYHRIYRPDHSPMTQEDIEHTLAALFPHVSQLPDPGASETCPAVVIADITEAMWAQVEEAGFLVYPLWFDHIKAFIPTGKHDLNERIDVIQQRMKALDVAMDDLDDTGIQGAPVQIQAWYHAASATCDVPTMLVCLLAAEGDDHAEAAVLSWKTENQ